MTQVYFEIRDCVVMCKRGTGMVAYLDFGLGRMPSECQMLSSLHSLVPVTLACFMAFTCAVYCAVGIIVVDGTPVTTNAWKPWVFFFLVVQSYS